MKILGKKSVSSVLEVIVSIAFYCYLIGAVSRIASAFYKEGQFFKYMYGSLSLIYCAYAAFLLKRVFNSLKEELPFTLKNYLNLKRLGVLIILFSVINTAVKEIIPYYSSVAITSFIDGVFNFTDDAISVVAGSFPEIILGLIVLVIAEVIKKATEMYEDQKFIL
jgi:hypothetical protein